MDHGGYFLYEDSTGVYGFEAEKLIEPEMDHDHEDARWTVYRVCLERYKTASVVEEDGSTRTFLVPIGYQETWSHPVASYVPWFFSDLPRVAGFVDATRDELLAALCGEDGRLLAWAYECIASYHGWENFDEYPVTRTKAEVEARYTQGEL